MSRLLTHQSFLFSFIGLECFETHLLLIGRRIGDFGIDIINQAIFHIHPLLVIDVVIICRVMILLLLLKVTLRVRYVRIDRRLHDII